MNSNKLNNIKPLGDCLPKTCQTCGSNFRNLPEFWNNTRPLESGTFSEGPKDSILIYRNCTCGSTLTLRLQDRRDYSQSGMNLRKKFRDSLQKHLDEGKTWEEAESLVREELNI